MVVFESEDVEESVTEEDEPVIYLNDLVKSMGNMNVLPILGKVSAGSFELPSDEDSIDGQDLESAVIEYDERIIGYKRKKLLMSCFREKDSVSMVAVNKFDQKIHGYICIRTNNIGKGMVGPLYAEDDGVAELLMNRATSELDCCLKKGLLFMPLDSNPGSLRMAEKMRLTKHEILPRFFTKGVPDWFIDYDRIYCIHSPNFSPFWNDVKKYCVDLLIIHYDQSERKKPLDPNPDYVSVNLRKIGYFSKDHLRARVLVTLIIMP